MEKERDTDIIQKGVGRKFYNSEFLKKRDTDIKQKGIGKKFYNSEKVLV